MEKLNRFFEEIMNIITHAQDNKFITEDAADILRTNIHEAYIDITEE